MGRPLPEPEHAVRVLKNDVPGRCVWLVQRPGEPARVVKQWRLGPILFIKQIARSSSPQRQHQGAQRSVDAGVATTKLSGPPRVVRRGRRRLVELEYDYIEGDELMTLARHGDLPEDEARRIGQACGRIVAAYAAAGLLHRDLKLSNLVRDAGGRVLVIDTNWVRPEQRQAVATARMLERLDIEPRDQGIDVAHAARHASLRAALASLSRPARREAIQRLRARRLR